MISPLLLYACQAPVPASITSDLPLKTKTEQSYVFQLGRVDPRKTPTRTLAFRIENTSSNPIQIVDIMASCGCLLLGETPVVKLIPANGHVDVSVSINFAKIPPGLVRDKEVKINFGGKSLHVIFEMEITSVLGLETNTHFVGRQIPGSKSFSELRVRLPESIGSLRENLRLYPTHPAIACQLVSETKEPSGDINQLYRISFTALNNQGWFETPLRFSSPRLQTSFGGGSPFSSSGPQIPTVNANDALTADSIRNTTISFQAIVTRDITVKPWEVDFGAINQNRVSKQSFVIESLNPIKSFEISGNSPDIGVGFSEEVIGKKIIKLNMAINTKSKGVFWGHVLIRINDSMVYVPVKALVMESE